MNDEQLIQVPQQAPTALTTKDVMSQVQEVQALMKAAMREGEHFGVIPGTKGKPTLLQPGAQKLSLMFRLAPEYAVIRRELEGGHVEYEVMCRLTHQVTGNFVGSGVGLCSTMETKYRYRGGAHICPECGVAAIIKGRAEYGGGWLCFGKKGGCGAKFPDDHFKGSAERVENPDIADSFNTVLKMSKKRAYVDAVLTATAASDIFTQDIGDNQPPEEHVPEPPPRPKPAGKKPLSVNSAVEPAKYKALCETLTLLGCRKGHPEDCDAVLAYCIKDWTLRFVHAEQGACDTAMDRLIDLQGGGMTSEDIYREAIKASGRSDLEKQGEQTF